MIFTSFSPNLTFRDVRKALLYLFCPWMYKNWYYGKERTIVIEKLKKYFSISHAICVDSGRSSLYLTLKAMGVRQEDEVLVQGYTCMVVANAIRFTGATPVFVDIGSGFCMNAEDAKAKMTPKTKVMIIQHTFGNPAPLNELLSLAKENNILVIEDLAHAYGATFEEKKLGTFGDAAILSFGSDKVVSSVRGGAIITGNDDLYEKIIKLVDELPKMKKTMLIQHLLHYPIFFLGKALYAYYVGKIILHGAKKIKLLNLILTEKEKKGGRDAIEPCLYPNVLATLLIPQLDEVDEINKHRKSIAEAYFAALENNELFVLPPKNSDSIYLRFTIRVKNPKQLMQCSKQNNVLLGDWYDRVIAPKDADIYFYKQGSCPNAELLASESVNLPTDRHINCKKVENILEVINKCQLLK